MHNDTSLLQAQIEKLEQEMLAMDFWTDKNKAQATIRQIADLKDALLGSAKYDKGNATLSILSGAGGDDAEDFSSMLLRMYLKYIEKKGWQVELLHEHKNDTGGYRNVSIEVIGRDVYGTLKNESGVHRLVRISPFNAKSLRHTSFSLVEIVPHLKSDDTIIEIPAEDLRIEFSKSGGPGGQNVNKRETAVRITHIPTNLSVHASTERSQEQNRARALDLLRGKLYKKRQEDELKEKQGLSISQTASIEWGSQIRNYVLHPYKLVKDLRTGVETSNVDGVLEDGELDIFIEAERQM